MHEIAAHAQHIKEMNQRRPTRQPNDHGASIHAYRRLPRGVPHPQPGSGHRNEHPQPQMVWGHKIHEVKPAITPLRPRRRLRHRGVWHQQAVIAHAKHLVGQRHRDRRQEDLPPIFPIHNQQHQARQAPIQRQFWAHQPAQARTKRQQIAVFNPPPQLGILRPLNHEEPPRGNPQQGQTPLQARGGEIPGWRQRNVQYPPKRQEQQPIIALIEFRSGHGRNEQGHSGEDQRRPQGNSLQPGTTYQCANINNVLP